MTSDKYDSNFIFLSENAVNVSYKQIEETLGAPTHTNIAIASFSTAFARIRLHKALNLLGDRVLYMDTDSIIFVDTLNEETNKWNSKIEASFCLGDFTDELGNNTYITEFVSTGPKSYSYKTNDEKKNCCKVKGFSLSQATSINFESIKQIVLDDTKRKMNL